MPRTTLPLLCLACALLPSLAAQAAPLDGERRPALPEIMLEALETEVALSALPPHLRDGATIYLYRRGGYQQAREGSNGFAAIVGRVGVVPFPYEGSVVPLGYDAEGVRTHLPRMLDEARLLEEGLTFAEVDRRIDRGMRDGSYPPPLRPGITYMLSGTNILPLPRLGVNIHYLPHFMFYAPNLTNADVGGPPGPPIFGTYPFKVRSDLGPHSFIILPVGVAERRRILEEQRDLFARVTAFLGSSVPPLSEAQIAGE